MAQNLKGKVNQITFVPFVKFRRLNFFRREIQNYRVVVGERHIFRVK